MSLTATQFRLKLDFEKSHRLATDLMAYSSTRFPAFDGTLANVSSYVLETLADIAVCGRRVLEAEVPEEKERASIMTKPSCFVFTGGPKQDEPLPVQFILNGIIHAKKIWLNHAKGTGSWEPCGDFVIQGFGIKTDKREYPHIDLFGFAHGFLGRPAISLNTLLKGV